MNSTFEQIEKNKVKISINIDAERFEEGMQDAYLKIRGNVNIPGFRKGRAPRKLIEANYGKEVFYEDAVNFALPDAYEKALEELKLEVVSRPEFKMESLPDEDGVNVSAEVYIKPEVTIKKEDYVGLQYEKMEAEVTDEEINGEIDKVREQNARMLTVTDRPIADGDIAVIDFEGFMDGVAFDGGKGTDYELTIGSKTFIDTFEEQLIGHNVGDDLEVNVNFPEDYGNEDLKGKPAMFKVEIKDVKVKELPEVDDDLAQDVSEFDTLADYKKDIKEKLAENKKAQAERKREDELVKALIAKAEMEVPEVMIENQIDQMVNDFANQIRMQGLSLEMYMQYIGQDMNSMRAAYRPGAENQVKGRLALEAVAKVEGFVISDGEIDEEIQRIAENYGMEKDQLLESMRPEDRKGLENDIAVKKAMDLVIENAKEIQ